MANWTIPNFGIKFKNGHFANFDRMGVYIVFSGAPISMRFFKRSAIVELWEAMGKPESAEMV